MSYCHCNARGCPGCSQCEGCKCTADSYIEYLRDEQLTNVLNHNESLQAFLDEDRAEIQRLKAELAKRDAPLEGLSPGDDYTILDVALIEHQRGKPYDRMRETVEQRDAMRQLLAVLCRDGGHYDQKHGTKKAVAHALENYYALVHELDQIKFAMTLKPCGSCDYCIDGMECRSKVR